MSIPRGDRKCRIEAVKGRIQCLFADDDGCLILSARI